MRFAWPRLGPQAGSKGRHWGSIGGRRGAVDAEAKAAQASDKIASIERSEAVAGDLVNY
jgi:hypothetical protein